MIDQAAILATSIIDRVENGRPAALCGSIGLPLLDRTIMTMGRAGISTVRVLVEGDSSAAIRRLVEAGRDYAARGIDVACVEVTAADECAVLAQAARELSGAFILARADRLYDPALIAMAMAGEVGVDELVVHVDARHDGNGANPGVVVADRRVQLAGAGERESHVDCGLYGVGEALAGRLEELASAGDFAALVASVDARAVEIGEWFCFSLATAKQRKLGQRALAKSLARQGVEGPIAKWLNKPISLRITPYLGRAGITPNQITIGSSVVGLIGAAIVLQLTWLGLAIGATLVHVQSVLDGCDGETARLKFQASRFGEWLDHVADDVSTAAYGLALGYFAMKAFDQPVYIWLAVAGVAGFAVYNLVMSIQLVFIAKSGSPYHFRWWFQKSSAYLKHDLAKAGIGGRLVAAFHACGRRDLFVFAFMLFAWARLPQVMVVWFMTIGVAHGGLAVVHVLVGGMRRAASDK